MPVYTVNMKIFLFFYACTIMAMCTKLEVVAAGAKIFMSEPQQWTE